MVKRSPNAFQRTIVHFDHGGVDADLFSRACVEQYDDSALESFGYLFAQVFEPHVLHEVAALEGQPIEALERLEYGASERMERLRAQLRGGAASIIALVNTAAALISLSRFGLAAEVLASIRRSDCDDRALFEVAMLEFVISNRLANAEGMRAAFAHMRRAIERSKLPAERLLDASGQAVVWRLKTKAIDEREFQWFLDLGKQVIAQERGSESGARSSWYRAVAMIPAAKGDKAATRELMLRARRTAEETLVSRPRAYETHFLKTYHESALKEHMYLTGDKDAALAEADALIALDPYWSHPAMARRPKRISALASWSSPPNAMSAQASWDRLMSGTTCLARHKRGSAWEGLSAPCRFTSFYCR